MNASFNYTNAAERERLIEAERKVTDDRVRAVIALKKQVCTEENGYTFVVVNQKGIDPLSLDMLAKEGIIGIRRAKVRARGGWRVGRRVSGCCWCVALGAHVALPRLYVLIGWPGAATEHGAPDSGVRRPGGEQR